MMMMENRRISWKTGGCYVACASSFFRNVASTSKVRSNASISIGYEAVGTLLAGCAAGLVRLLFFFLNKFKQQGEYHDD